jgi:hypothetical protein
MEVARVDLQLARTRGSISAMANSVYLINSEMLKDFSAEIQNII